MNCSSCSIYCAGWCKTPAIVHRSLLHLTLLAMDFFGGGLMRFMLSWICYCSIISFLAPAPHSRRTSMAWSVSVAEQMAHMLPTWDSGADSTGAPCSYWPSFLTCTPNWKKSWLDRERKTISRSACRNPLCRSCTGLFWLHTPLCAWPGMAGSFANSFYMFSAKRGHILRFCGWQGLNSRISRPMTSAAWISSHQARHWVPVKGEFIISVYFESVMHFGSYFTQKLIEKNRAG